MVIESWRNGTANQRIRIIVVKRCCKPRTLVGERKSLCSNLADIAVLALLIFFFGFLAFDYELLESRTELTTMRWDVGQN